MKIMFQRAEMDQTIQLPQTEDPRWASTSPNRRTPIESKRKLKPSQFMFHKCHQNNSILCNLASQQLSFLFTGTMLYFHLY